MSKYVIGIDPDSKAHGVAIYKDKVLTELKCMPLTEFVMTLESLLTMSTSIEVHIENVCGNNGAFINTKKHIKNKNAATSISRTLGMCQQAQIELERWCEHYSVKVVRHKISRAWKKEKQTFALMTKWGKPSNEDTRSAAYFGFLGCK